MTVEPSTPDWVQPGSEVFVVTHRLDSHEMVGRLRRVTVSRVGVRYVVVTDAMGNELKFATETLSRPRRGTVDTLKSLLDPSLLEDLI